MALRLRRARRTDMEFLFSLYASTRTEELAVVDWTPAQKEGFLRMQFRAQDAYYRENYPGALFQVVLLDRQPVGRLYLHRRPDEIRVMDISLLPEYRGRGIGTTLLRQVLQEGTERCLPVTIHVERFNPARSLYERLGFQLVEDQGVYLFMKRLPSTEEGHVQAG